VVLHLSGRDLDKGTKVVFPEGYTLTDIGKALEKAKITSALDFITTATDPAVVASLGAPGPTFEGYLFPDTYYFDAPTTPREVIKKMYQTFLNRIDNLGIPRQPGLKSLVTLASIVQEETGIAEEMPAISGVYVNRLTSPNYPSRLLQADPVVSYGCQPFVVPKAPSCSGFKGLLKRRQLDDSTNPYNTYKHPGLPPGPISAPGIRALEAAHKPKKVPYLFFVASPKGDGSHVFSTTLEEHEKAVRAYWSRSVKESAERSSTSD
jgi:UPF0755 protein